MNQGKFINKLIFNILFVVFFLSTPSIADDNHYNSELNYCNPFYSDIQKIYISYKQELPKVVGSAEWDKIALHAIKLTKEMLSETGISVEMTNENPERILVNEKNVLYINLIYSFGAANSFSVPPEQDVLANWLILYRYFKNDFFDGEIIKKNSPTKLQLFDDKSSNSMVYLSSAPYGLLENVACQVLQANAALQCTNTNLFSNNELVPMSVPCIKRQYEGEDAPGKFFKNNKRNQ